MCCICKKIGGQDYYYVCVQFVTVRWMSWGNLVELSVLNELSELSEVYELSELSDFKLSELDGLSWVCC